MTVYEGQSRFESEIKCETHSYFTFQRARLGPNLPRKLELCVVRVHLNENLHPHHCLSILHSSHSILYYPWSLKHSRVRKNERKELSKFGPCITTIIHKYLYILVNKCDHSWSCCLFAWYYSFVRNRCSPGEREMVSKCFRALLDPDSSIPSLLYMYDEQVWKIVSIFKISIWKRSSV